MLWQNLLAKQPPPLARAVPSLTMPQTQNISTESQQLWKKTNKTKLSKLAAAECVNLWRRIQRVAAEEGMGMGTGVEQTESSMSCAMGHTHTHTRRAGDLSVWQECVWNEEVWPTQSGSGKLGEVGVNVISAARENDSLSASVNAAFMLQECECGRSAASTSVTLCVGVSDSRKACFFCFF